MEGPGTTRRTSTLPLPTTETGTTMTYDTMIVEYMQYSVVMMIIMMQVYLVDFAVFEPPQEWKLSPEQLMSIMRDQVTEVK